jgi:hypothetical protein
MIYAHEQREKKARYIGPRPGYPKVQLRYADTMSDYLGDRHLSYELAVFNGWYPTHYRGSARVVIPCSNSAGVPYFQARDMSGESELRYASPPAPRDDSVVLVWPELRAKGTVIVEGPMDALAAAGLGFLGIAVMGNQPTAEVIDHIVPYAKSFQPVIVLPDADALYFGPYMLGSLVQRGIDGAIRAPYRKDLAEMSPKERRVFLT